MKRRILFFLLLISLASVLLAQDFRGDAYPLDICIVTGEKIGEHGDPIVYDYNGREIRFCCRSCISDFEKNTGRYLKKLDKIIIAQQLPYYPLNTCIATGGAFDMGAPRDFVYKNRLFRFCCRGCINRLKRNPAKYFADLDKAVIARQKSSYPLSTCVVSGKKLVEGKSIDLVHANRLVRLYCPECVEKFRKNPARYLRLIDARFDD